MSIQIIYSKKILIKLNLTWFYFLTINSTLKALSNYLSKSELTYIHDLLKTSRLKKKILFLK